MDLTKIKTRLGIDSDDTGFDPELNGWIEDATTELSIYVGDDITDADKLLPSYGMFIRNYVLLMFKGDDMTAQGHSTLLRSVEDQKENFYVERFNRLNDNN